MPTYDEIIRALKQRKPQRVYLLAGDEPLFIDQIASFAAKEFIPEEERDFNQSILYGAEVTARTILLEALRFPMMGTHVLVLVREAQQVRDLDTIAAHLDELPESTCLILCYKKKADKRKALYKASEGASMSRRRCTTPSSPTSSSRASLLGIWRSIHAQLT